MLDIEPESEDEDAIIERRRQLRQAIVQKYRNNSQPPTEASSINPSPAPPSEADSDIVGNDAAKDLEETIQQEEMKLKLKRSESKEVNILCTLRWLLWVLMFDILADWPKNAKVCTHQYTFTATIFL